MELLTDKLKEVLASVLPIVVIVLILSFFFVDVSQDMMLRFVIGAILLILGLTIFLFGVDVGMAPIGEHMGVLVAESTTRKVVALLSFILGFSVTVAEPDLLILGQQVSDAFGGTISTYLIVFLVSIGVGIMIAWGVVRILASFPIKYFFLIFYGIALCLGLFASNDFIAIAFDASGATTGALTTPFILSLGAAVSAQKGGRMAEEDSFGLVGAMSVGPILAVMLLSILMGSDFQGSEAEYLYTEGIIQPFIQAIGHTLVESALALAPLVIFFFIMNAWRLKIKKSGLMDIVKGVIYTMLGLVLFLIGVNQGFLDMGRFLGTHLAENYSTWLPLLGFMIGMVVVLAEPAVHVLGDQVEEVTGGYINSKLLLGALSIGVGLAVGGSILRIMNPSIQIWHYLLPGFIVANLLSFLVDDLFTGIAFDAGGVASGPMTATFILAFAQGAADFFPQANVVTDGFGIIATVAMAPVVMIQLLGLIFKLKVKRVG
ncbi:DUF1538 domain-containing protein [Facklamia sp. DSM 111018]|uniref:DUF1538 domain-containing protein n=1 Tax=Facklamia lactis TaxID=2749967 RepID=A0ABS0LN95_9LACT|nr:DUF1538 domain-containing protein [Facklamia lactis]MBG9979682.1 DUF1538 domain-containing protein [Facklamia lactis]MBG9985638.1 DUF1538 domain-containing protein [Facklamia lactis]